ncbi:monovalent cation/H+ antiporter complex subunit F [Dietzia sp.]|uniref:monovalent cation/H+ antiporter complex subunit F n=1 Tax=Dietzia sp. TaxID=1871616 RepID=UPI002FD8B319
MSALLMWLLGISLGIMAAAVVATAVRIVIGPDDQTRIVLADLVFFGALGLFTLFVIRRGSAVAVDVMLIGSLIGILSTVALARMISGGRR